ncbi:MAG: PLP-dependent aminotransferase family protein [Planctomycetota bacterium]
MRLTVDRSDSRPVYLQIREGIRRRIVQGELLPGTKLPSSRTLAGTLGVHRSTVVSAYRDLVSEGILSCGVGQGTFVVESPKPLTSPHETPGRESLPREPATREPFNWAALLARRPRAIRGELSRDLRPASSRPDTICFDRAIPDPALYPTAVLERLVAQVLRGPHTRVYDYGPPAGYEPLRELLKHRLAAAGVNTQNDEVLIVNGSQQALHLVMSLLLDERSGVVVENPTFAGALDILRLQGVSMVSVPMDEGGLSIAALEDTLRVQRPTLLYTVPTFHNPTGLTLEASRRRELVEIACREQIPILEDDWLGDLRAPEDAPPLKAHDRAGHVITLSTFSKTVVPGLRVGWLVAPRAVFEPLCTLKARFDICTNLFGQVVLCELARTGELDRQIVKVREVYARRLAAVLAAVDRSFPREITTSRPSGGITLWVHLPPQLDLLQVSDEARSNGVMISPGQLFTPEGGRAAGFRLCFSTTSEEQIERGIAILGRVLEQQLQRSSGETSRTDGPPLV